MALTCCNSPSFFNMCFGSCMGPLIGYKRCNKIVSNNNINEFENEATNSASLDGTKADPLERNRGAQKSEHEKCARNNSGHKAQESPGVIVKQPISRIKILNVTYRKNVYKKNTVNHRPISSAVYGHVRNATRHTFNSASIETIPEGK